MGDGGGYEFPPAQVAGGIEDGGNISVTEEAPLYDGIDGLQRVGGVKFQRGLEET